MRGRKSTSWFSVDFLPGLHLELRNRASSWIRPCRSSVASPPTSRKSRSSRRPRRKLDLTPQCEQLEIKIAPATLTLTGASSTLWSNAGNWHAVNQASTTTALTSGTNPSVSAQQASTTTALTSDTNPSVSGQSVKFTATVAAVSPGSGTPTGTVDFFDGTKQLDIETLTAGVATFSTSTLTVGPHSITVRYFGDTNFTTSISSAVSQDVKQASTTTVPTSDPNPSVSGQSVTFTATIAAVSPGSGTPTGTVDFFDGTPTIGTTPLDTETLQAGVATFSTSTLTVATHSITAVYSGDTNFTTSTSSVAQDVKQASTTTALTSDPNPSVSGQSVTFTATIAAVSPGSGTPTGTVDFFDGTPTIGTTPLDTETLKAGVATFSTSTLTVAMHSITAVYSGDTNFTTSTSSVAQDVKQASTTSAHLRYQPQYLRSVGDVHGDRRRPAGFGHADGYG